MVVDAIHLGGVAVWLGGLAVLVLFLLRQVNQDEREAIMPIWSRWAGYAVSVVLLAGVVSALIEVGTPNALVSTSYGRYILIKLALVGVIIAVASQARRLLLTATLRKLVIAELTIAATILGVTAVLTSTTPARTAEAVEQAPPPAQIFSTTVEGSKFRLQIEIDPAKAGEDNLVHLYAFKFDGQPQTVEEWTVSVAMPSAGIEPINVPVLRIPPEHATASIALPTPGDWVFSFTLRISEIDQDTVTATVPIK
jgi:copper transport protein